MSGKEICAWTAKELLALPTRNWKEVSVYDSVLLVPDNKKHASGWRIINIVGVRDGVPVEIAASCDDVCWQVSAARRFGPQNQYAIDNLRMDCAWKSRTIHAWGGFNDGWRFRVGISLSSTTIEVGNFEGEA